MAAGQRRLAGLGHGLLQGAGRSHRHQIAQIGRDLVRRLADQEGAAHAARCGRRLAKPPGLGLPPAIQKMSAKAVEARAAASGLVALLSLTKRTRPGAGHLLHAVRQPGEGRQDRSSHLRRRDPARGRRHRPGPRSDGCGARGRPAQVEVGDLPSLPVQRVHQHAVAHAHAAFRPLADAKPASPAGPARGGSRDLAARLVVDADHRGVARLLVLEDPALGARCSLRDRRAGRDGRASG